MIDKAYKKYHLVCDCCDTIGGSFDIFEDAVAYARQEGWQAVHSNGAWLNYCPDCKEDKQMHHYLAKYEENGVKYAEAWLQINIFGRCICFWKKKIKI